MIDRLLNRPHRFFTACLTASCLAIISSPVDAQVSLVKDIKPGSDGSVAQGLVVYGTSLVFSADDGAHGIEPWVSDGNTDGSGTQILANILGDDPPGTCGGSSGARWFTLADDLVYFLATEESDEQCVTKVWRTNATSAGTEATTVVTKYATQDGLMAMNGAQFVNGSAFLLNAWDPDGLTGNEVWKIDAGNQYVIKDIWPGSSSSNPLSFAVVGLDGVGERMFFSATEQDGSFHPWISDGSPAGTSVLKAINTISGHSAAMQFAGFDGKAWFQADDGINGAELWSSDGTTEGTSLFMDIYDGFDSNPGLFTVVGDLMFFSAKSDHQGFRLWVTDGTQENTHEVVESAPGVAPESAETMVAYEDKLYFTAGELWVSDGTEAGTFMVTDLEPGPSSSQPKGLTVADGKLYFSAYTTDHGRELWVSNGTAAGTMIVEDIFPGETLGIVNSSWAGDFVEFGGALYFFATDGAFGRELRKLPLTDFVTTPDAPTGPESGQINTTLSFSGEGSISLEGDDVQYRFSWGDESDSGWLSVGATSADHQWTEPGTYNVAVETRAASDTGVVSKTSPEFEVEILYDETISGASVTGSSTGWVDNEYPFTIDAISSKGHEMEYQLNWGDGSITNWATLGSEGSEVSHAWSSAGPYQITATVRCAEHTDDADDDADHSITITDETLSDPTLTGPSAGGNGISYSYTLSAESAAGHDLEFWISWGDGEPEPDIDWTPFGEGVTSVQHSHAWPELGGYEVLAKVRCSTHQSIIKDVALWVSLEDEYIHSVTLSGPASGYTGVEYDYAVSGESSWGHALEYAASWGDGSPDIGWTPFPQGQNTVIVSHAWSFEAPDFPVWVGVRCAEHHVENGDDMTVAIVSAPAGLIFADGFETNDVTRW